MSIEFTDAEIGSLAVELNLDLRGQEKIDVLRAFESCDIQAGPGTGKTTMLTAKLALLARKWPRADCGILVLSHTNAARREIERRLSQSKSLRQLLTYPHFVGTFQAFVDRFLALPYLRQKAIEMTAVDDDIFAARATSLFDSGACPVARAALEKRYESHPKRSREVLGTLRFDGVNLRITHSAEREKRFPGSDSKTGKELRTCMRWGSAAFSNGPISHRFCGRDFPGYLWMSCKTPAIAKIESLRRYSADLNRSFSALGTRIRAFLILTTPQ